MNARADTPPYSSERRLLSALKVRHLANVFIVASVFVVLGTTLYPFDFTTDEFDQRLEPFLHQDLTKVRGYEDDIVTNIILFIPIGFSFGILATRKKARPLHDLILVTLAGGALSLMVELLQLFLPFRFSSLMDVASNAAGSAVGFFLYKGVARVAYRALTGAIERINTGHKVGWLTAMYLLYLACLLAGSLPLQRSSFIAEFNKSDYPLVVGNEPGGARPWKGAIKELIVAKYSFSIGDVSDYLAGREMSAGAQQEVVAHYIFQGRAPYRDIANRNAPLEWKGKYPDTLESDEAEAARIMPKRWLQTNKGVNQISDELMETLRFTVCITVASKDSRQTQTARIVAVASDPYRQNFSIVQIGDDLGVRFRSMTTGMNGTNPQFMINGVFTDTLMHRIVATLTPSHLRVFVDSIGQSYGVELGPGFALLNKFFPTNGKLSISSPMKNFHRVLFAVIVFVPLGYLLALLVSEVQKGVVLRIFIASIGIAAPPYLLERVLCYLVAREISMPNLLIGLALMFGTVLITLSSRLYRIRIGANGGENA